MHCVELLISARGERYPAYVNQSSKSVCSALSYIHMLVSISFSPTGSLLITFYPVSKLPFIPHMRIISGAIAGLVLNKEWCVL